MEKESSSSDRLSLIFERNIDKEKEEKIDIVTALTTPFQPTAVRLHASTVKKMKEQEGWIKVQRKQTEELTFNLTIKDSHIENLKRDEAISRLPSLPTATNGFPEAPRTSSYCNALFKHILQNIKGDRRLVQQKHNSKLAKVETGLLYVYETNSARLNRG